jgi:phycocyanobilin:ferredoxin oxidoreductase
MTISLEVDDTTGPDEARGRDEARQPDDLRKPDLPAMMRQAALRVRARLEAVAGLTQLAPPAVPPHDPRLVWRNTLFSGAKLRRGHIELFEIPGHFAVLHVCLTPQTHSAAPIFGFDMVAGTAQATGIFLDFSPTCPGPPVPALRDAMPPTALTAFAQYRPRPAWGDCFSEDFFAIRPASMAEAATAVALAETALDHYLRHLDDAAYVRGTVAQDGQAAYARAQRRNPHTFRMLSGHVGASAAREFIDEVLFPLPA